MNDSEDVKSLLAEIRQLQREHLAEYRSVTQQSLELQKRSVTRQEELGALYRRVVVAALTTIIAIVVIILLLLRRLLG